MPNGGPTRPTRVVGRSLNVLGYALSLLVGLGDLFAPASFLLDAAPRAWVVVSSSILVVASVVGLASVTAHRWRAEWVAATVIAFLLLAQSVPVWDRIFTGFPDSTSVAAMMALGAICLAQRALNLWIFFLRTLQTAEQSSDAQ